MSRGQNTHCALSLSLSLSLSEIDRYLLCFPCQLRALRRNMLPAFRVALSQRIIYSDSEQSDSPKKVLATDHFWREADIRRCVGVSYGRRRRRRPAAQGRAMSNGCTFSPPVIRGFDGSKRSRSSRFLTRARATTKASFRLLACRSATLKKAFPK